MPRYEWGPSQDYTERADAGVSLRGVRPKGLVDLTIEPADPTTTSKLTGLFALYLPAAPGPADTPQSVLAAATLVGAASADQLVAGDVTIKVNGVRPGLFYVQVILEFDQ